MITVLLKIAVPIQIYSMYVHDEKDMIIRSFGSEISDSVFVYIYDIGYYIIFLVIGALF